jgi:hypothetical protein
MSQRPRPGPTTATVEVYDPAVDFWQGRNRMPTARRHLAVAAIGHAPTGAALPLRLTVDRRKQRSSIRCAYYVLEYSLSFYGPK